VERIAAGTISVVVLGETGVGKEVVAETIHRLSPRADRPFLRLNCAALSESLLESELFGHERGAFTGAAAPKPGLLETADGGTVLLDEVGELPIALQAKLLRVIEQRQVLRVGGLRPRAIDVRFVAATNRDLEQEVIRGNFRQDLFFRLNGVMLVIPPLRERVVEIEPLAREFIREVCRKDKRRPEPVLSVAALDLMERYGWPGNIRELRNVVERAVLLCAEGVIGVEHLPVEKMRASLAPQPKPSPRVASRSEAQSTARELDKLAFNPAEAFATPLGAGGEPSGPNIRAEMAVIERMRILEALDHTAGNQTQAARLLGMSRRTLVNRLNDYGIIRPRKGRR
jgi:transcriptional regulator with GAF, ATPase, and Fis domain